MNTINLKQIAKQSSNEDLLDIIAQKLFTEEELIAFREEVKLRGLERQLTKVIEDRANNKIRIINGAKQLSDEEVVLILCYNHYKFSDAELIPFRDEVKRRGLETALAAVMEKEEAASRHFKETVLDASDDPIELLDKFNTYSANNAPMAMRAAKEGKVKNKERQSFMFLISGALLLLFGVAFIMASRANAFFYALILLGLILLVKSMIDKKA